jgi:hypothetical protein
LQGLYKKAILEKHLNLRQQNQGSVIFGLDSFAEGVIGLDVGQSSAIVEYQNLIKNAVLKS